MKPNYQLARAAAIYQTQLHDIPMTDEYKAAREAVRIHRNENLCMEDFTLLDAAAEILAHYVLSIPDQFEEGKRAGYADAQPNPMPSLFDRFGGPGK